VCCRSLGVGRERGKRKRRKRLSTSLEKGKTWANECGDVRSQAVQTITGRKKNQNEKSGTKNKWTPLLFCGLRKRKEGKRLNTRRNRMAQGTEKMEMKRDQIANKTGQERVETK